MLAAVVLAAASVAYAQDAARAASERSIKAAYLLKFPADVEWPAGRFIQPTSPLTIGVLGGDAVAEELSAVAVGRTVNGRPVRVRRLANHDQIAQLDVLFVPDPSRSEAARIAAAAAAAAAAESILTVTDSKGASGGVIDFTMVDGRVRFEVYLGAGERNGLRFHSGLLAVAARVHGARR